MSETEPNDQPTARDTDPTGEVLADYLKQITEQQRAHELRRSAQTIKQMHNAAYAGQQLRDIAVAGQQLHDIAAAGQHLRTLLPPIQAQPPYMPVQDSFGRTAEYLRTLLPLPAIPPSSFPQAGLDRIAEQINADQRRLAQEATVAYDALVRAIAALAADTAQSHQAQATDQLTWVQRDIERVPDMLRQIAPLHPNANHPFRAIEDAIESADAARSDNEHPHGRSDSVDLDRRVAELALRHANAAPFEISLKEGAVTISWTGNALRIEWHELDDASTD